MTLPCPITAYADANDLTVREAILAASTRGLLLCKHADPIEGERIDIGDDTAIEIAITGDVGLIYVAEAAVVRAGEAAYYADHCLLAGRRVPQSALDLVTDSDDYVWVRA